MSFVHGLWFPTRVDRVGPRGEVLASYWSNGYVTRMQAARLHGAEVVFLGATNNELKGASLALFDRDAVRGSAPAENVAPAARPARPVAVRCGQV